jgi:hypothetical protein
LPTLLSIGLNEETNPDFYQKTTNYQLIHPPSRAYTWTSTNFGVSAPTLFTKCKGRKFSTATDFLSIKEGFADSEAFLLTMAAGGRGSHLAGG